LYFRVYARLELLHHLNFGHSRIDSISETIQLWFHFFLISGIFVMCFSKVAFDILNHLPARYESSRGQSGGLISPDVCTPEVLVKIFLLMITMQLFYLI